MIKAIISDVGNVLVRFDPNIMDDVFSEHMDYSILSRQNSYFSSFMQKGYYDKLERGHISNEEFFRCIKKDFALELDYENFKEQFFKFLFVDDYTKNNLRQLEEYSSKGVKVVLLSNTNPIHFPKLIENWSELDKFDKILSYEVGLRKPETEIYLKAVERTGNDISECLFIDDVPDFVNKFKSLGGKGIVYIPGTKLEIDLSKF